MHDFKGLRNGAEIFLKKDVKRFGGLAESVYLCTRFWETTRLQRQARGPGEKKFLKNLRE